MGELIGIAIVISALSFGIIGYKCVAADSKSKRAKQSGEFDEIHSELQQLKEHGGENSGIRKRISISTTTIPNGHRN